MSKGIDVSSHQGVIDWQQVRDARYEFAFIRASRGNIVDDKFATNWQNASAAGMLIAPYHVVYESPSAAEQVSFLLSLLPKNKNFPLVLDVEVNPPVTILQRTQEMLDLLKDYHTVIYTGAWWWDPATAGQDVEWAVQADLWTASYTTTPFLPREPWDDWRVWQYTNEGRVPGISGNVDLNNFNGNDLYEWWMNMTTIEVTEPVLITMGNKTLLRLIPPHTEPEPPQPEPQWAFPVGEGAYPPERWYAANLHTPTGSYRHIGIDLNLDVSPWGDIERTLGLSVFAIADGEITYYTANWSGVPMIVMRTEHDGAPLWVRYAHITPVVQVGQKVKAGERLGGFANWTGNDGGDHLHFDMATAAYTREYLDSGIPFVDPVPVLKVHLDPIIVDEMLKKN